MKASNYPIAVNAVEQTAVLTDTARKLARSAAGSGHDNWLQGVRVAFDIDLTAKALVELERYHFADIVSCTSTMHRAARFDLNETLCPWVDGRVKAVLTELICEYRDDPAPEKYLQVLYNMPAGFTYTLRVTTNYRQLKTIYAQRKDHRLPEWREICAWIETLPHSDLMTGGNGK